VWLVQRLAEEVLGRGFYLLAADPPTLHQSPP
jgi:hypothetical protein